VLSVIIVSYNTRVLTLRLLESLHEHVSTTAPEILVVDNRSRDGSAQAIARFFPEVRLIKLDRNIGFGAAVNLAVDEARGDYIWLLNSDCHLTGNPIEQILDYLKSNTQVAAVAGRLIDRNGSFQASCRRFPTFRNILFSRQSPLAPFDSVGSAYTLPDYEITTSVESCSGTNTVIRKDRFQAVGGFDERFFMYCEDTDLCRRFADAGWGIVFMPGESVVHGWAESWRGDELLRYYHHHRSFIRYFAKHFQCKPVAVELLELFMIVSLGIRIAVSKLRWK
jgi:GT2 family glycosyltransferase